MKQNKKYSAIIIAIIVLVSNLAITGFAYTDNSINNVDFNNQPIVNNHTGNEFLDGTHLFNTYVTSDHSQETYYYAYTEQDKEYYAFLAGSNSYTLYVVGQVSGIAYLSISSNNVVAQNVTLDCRQIIDNNTGLYGRSYSIGSPISAYTYESDIPIFNSDSDGYAAVLDWIDNPPASNNPQPFSYSIPAGYALAVDISGLSPTGKLTTATNRAFASPHVSNQTIAYVDSIPTNGTAPLGNGISWNGIGNKDLIGRYKSWQHNLIPQPNKSYLVVYNPVHIDNYVDPEHEDYNSAINITLTEAYGGRLIALNTELTSSGQVGTVSSDNGGDISYDEETNTWNTLNPDGTPYNPSPYGDYLPNTQNSVHDWLENISNQISGFFTGAIGAITNLVSAGSAFFQTLIGLYGWLPISVMSVLSSALIIVITIGVIKVFL